MCVQVSWSSCDFWQSVIPVLCLARLLLLCHGLCCAHNITERHPFTPRANITLPSQALSLIQSPTIDTCLQWRSWLKVFGKRPAPEAWSEWSQAITEGSCVFNTAGDLEKDQGNPVYSCSVKSLFFFNKVSVKGGASPSDVAHPPQGIKLNVTWFFVCFFTFILY